MTKLRHILANNVRQLMSQRGLKSQAAAAKVTGLAQTQIGNVLRGDKNATLSTLDALAKGLKVQPWQLLTPLDAPEDTP